MIHITNKIILMLLSLSFLMSSCTSESKDQLPSPNCDTVNMRYAADIVPILVSNCYGCHGAETFASQSGINLQDYNTLKMHADDGHLLGNITHTTNTPMPPPPAARLDDCTINKFLDWIKQGSPNN